jgi:uncharacterized protein YcnI
MLHQSFVYTRKSSPSLDKSTVEQSLMNDAKVTGTLIIYNTQITNEDASWRQITDKKRNQNSHKITTTRKQTKINRY